jgi:hypothetical protein
MSVASDLFYIVGLILMIVGINTLEEEDQDGVHHQLYPPDHQRL